MREMQLDATRLIMVSYVSQGTAPINDGTIVTNESESLISVVTIQQKA